MAPPFSGQEMGQLICQGILLDNPLKFLNVNIKQRPKKRIATHQVGQKPAREAQLNLCRRVIAER
jgi:hypothetical protein